MISRQESVVTGDWTVTRLALWVRSSGMNELRPRDYKRPSGWELKWASSYGRARRGEKKIKWNQSRQLATECDLPILEPLAGWLAAAVTDPIWAVRSKRLLVSKSAHLFSLMCISFFRMGYLLCVRCWTVLFSSSTRLSVPVCLSKDYVARLNAMLRLANSRASTEVQTERWKKERRDTEKSCVLRAEVLMSRWSAPSSVSHLLPLLLAALLSADCPDSKGRVPTCRERTFVEQKESRQGKRCRYCKCHFCSCADSADEPMIWRCVTIKHRFDGISFTVHLAISLRHWRDNLLMRRCGARPNEVSVLSILLICLFGWYTSDGLLYVYIKCRQDDRRLSVCDGALRYKSSLWCRTSSVRLRPSGICGGKTTMYIALLVYHTQASIRRRDDDRNKPNRRDDIMLRYKFSLWNPLFERHPPGCRLYMYARVSPLLIF